MKQKRVVTNLQALELSVAHKPGFSREESSVLLTKNKVFLASLRSQNQQRKLLSTKFQCQLVVKAAQHHDN
jgi:hypothetical protein